MTGQLARLVVVVTVVVAAVALGPVSGQCPNAKATLLTYNVGLTPTVADIDSRLDNVVNAITRQKDDADFMCLQEVWYEREMHRLISELEDDFPYHYSTLHVDVGQLRQDGRSGLLDRFFPGRRTEPCDTVKMGRLLVCYVWNCFSASGNAALNECIQNKCGNRINALSQACRSCIIVSTTGLYDVYDRCDNTRDMYNRMNQPGLLVFSKQPLSAHEYVNYHGDRKVLLERGYIRAQVGSNPTYVCTHLTAVFEDGYYEENLKDMYSTFAEQQAGEIAKLKTDFNGSPHVVLGDLNTGPARDENGFPVLEAEIPANYDLLIQDLGYHNPYFEHEGHCTYCPSENPVLMGAKIVYGNVLIDHILTKDVNSDPSSPQRLFNTTSLPLSDHYGVKLDICLP